MSTKSLELDDLRTRFAVFAPMPLLLERLLEWRNQWCLSYPEDELRYCLGFDLCGSKDALRLWFGDESPYDLSRLAIFAQDTEGSLLAYWFEKERDVDFPPIVLLHADGIPDSHVIANSLEELLILFNPTRKELETLSKRNDKQARTLIEFSDWLKDACGIESSKTSREVTGIERQAKERDESFQSWLYSA